MTPDQLNYYRQLSNELDEWKLSGKLYSHKYGDIVKLAPAFFKLLCDLQGDPNMPDTSEEILKGGIRYFLSDNDFLPESLVGLSGYIDDVIAAAYVIKEISKDVDSQYISMLWDGEKDLFTVIDYLLASADKILGRNLWNKIRTSL